MRIALVLLISMFILPLLASVVPLSLDEQLRDSQAIVDVTVTGKTTVEKGRAKFIYTRYSFEVHETLYGSVSRDLSLDFGGGEKGEIGMAISEVPGLVTGARYLLILESVDKPLICPIVGSYQGLYQAVANPSGVLELQDSTGRSFSPEPGITDYPGFLSYLRSRISYAKSLPQPNRVPLPSSEPYIIKNTPSKLFNPGFTPDLGAVVRPGRRTPSSVLPEAPMIDSQPLAPIITEPVAGGDRLTFDLWWQPLSCTFNQLVDTDPFSPHDEWQMAYWNEFTDMFRMLDNPVASWDFGNSVNDMVGVVDDDTYLDVFGGHWGSGVLGVCHFLYYANNHRLIEADIALNDAYTWSTDSYAVYDDAGVWPIDQTLLHELGHAVGAPHNFDDLSVMNYAPKRYRSYNVLFRDDAASSRAAYPASSVSVCNFSISSCRGDYVEGNCTTGIIPGNPVVASGITIQNSGTQSGTAVIAFYLCPTILSWDAATYLGNVTLQNFDANTESVLNNLSFNVPIGTPSGEYHIGLLITTANDQIWDDNESWFHMPTQILPTPIGGLWDGDVSGDWFDGQNWNDGLVPTINTSVTIPASTYYSPYIQAQNAQCFSLLIEPGASLTLVNYSLEINGNVDNQGIIYLLMDAFQLAINGTLNMDTGSSLITINPLTVITIGGNLTIENGANISSMQGRIEFIGSIEAFLTINDSYTVLNSVTVNKFASSLTFSSQSTAKLSIAGNLALGSYTTLRLESSQDTEIQGNITGSDTSALIATQGKLKMCGSASQIIQVPDLHSYLNHLEIASQGIVSSVYDLTIKGDLTISLGVFEAPYSIYINGHWNNTLGPDAFIEGVGSVFFQGEHHQYCSTENFNRLVINKNFGALRLLFANITCNSYVYGSGALDLLFGNFVANDLEQDGIYGDFYVNPFCRLELHQDISNYVDLNGTVNMLGGEFHVYGGSVTSWWAYARPAALNMIDGLVYFHSQGIEIPASGATLNISGGTLRTDGNFSLGINGFNAPNWTLYLSGTQDTGLWLAENAWLNNLVIDKSGRESVAIMRNRNGSPYPQTRNNTVYANTNLRIAANFNTLNGGLSAPAIMEVKGNWQGASTASFYGNNGRVVFSGDQLSQISVSSGFYDLEIYKQCDGLGVQLSSGVIINVSNQLNIISGGLGTTDHNVIDVNNDLTINNGAGLNLSGEAIELSLEGDVVNDNEDNTPVTGFYPGSSLTIFEGSDDQFFTAPTPISFHDLRIGIYNASFRPNRGVYAHDLEIVRGGYYPTPTASNCVLYGDLYVHYYGRWWDHNNILVLTGNEEQTIQIDAPADSCWFNRISLNKVQRSSGTRSQDVYLLSNLELRNQGILEIASANLDLNGNELTTTAYVDVNNYGFLNIPEDSALILGQGLYVRNNGTLNINGTEELPASISNYGSSRPFFQVEYNGRISAEWCMFLYLNASGVNVMPGAIVDPLKAFNNCSFFYGQSGGNALTLNDSGFYTVTGARFGENGWGSEYNVSKTEETGEVIFVSPIGSFSGPAFENDAYNRIQWPDYKPDLVVNSFSFSNYTPELTEGITARVCIRNDGNCSTSGGFWVDLFDNRATQPQFGDVADWSLLASDIAPGDSLVVFFENIYAHGDLVWNSWVLVDATQAVNEFNETNNAAGPVEVVWQEPALPNLLISSASYNAANPFVGQQISLTVFITNSSAVDVSNPVVVDLYLNPGMPPNGSTGGDLSHTFDAIAAGQTVSYTFTGISSSVAEIWQSYLLLDRTNSIIETDETDNTATPDPITWFALPEPTDVNLSYDPNTGLATLSWNCAFPAATFNVYWDSDPSGSFTNLLESTSNFQISFVPSASKAFYLIKAEN